MKRFFHRLSIQEKVMFAKRLSILVRSGNTLPESLRMIQSQPGSRSAAKIYSQMTKDVERGKFLSSSMEPNRKIFGDFAINVIRIGEMSGTLEENLGYLAEELQKKQELRRKVLGAMIYPAIVISATIALSIVLTVIIFPKILPIFESFRFELPFTTKVLVVVSGFFINYGIYLALALVALAVILFFLYRWSPFRMAVDRFTLGVPVFGRIAQGYYMANFCRTLGLLLKSQVLVVEATEIAGKTLGNRVYRREAEIMSKKIHKGEKMSAHLSKNISIFDPVMSQMVEVGEKSGTLSDTLIFISEFYENEVDMMTKNLSTMLEPVLMIFLGIIVGFIAVSIITPIYELTQYIN